MDRQKTDRQTDRQMDRQIDRQFDCSVTRQEWSNAGTDTGLSELQTDRQTDKREVDKLISGAVSTHIFLCPLAVREHNSSTSTISTSNLRRHHILTCSNKI